MISEPAIIIGAPRSGTNMLRDVLCRLDGLATWPCDEINYIWRYGNVRFSSDEFPPEFATSEVRSYIRRQFDWVANRYDAKVVIEKTCANSLRVPFVDAVLPEARFIFIHRHGLDAVGSAMKRWKAPLDIPYLAKKARFVPRVDLPLYAARYLWSRAYRFFSRERRLAFWGPQMDDLHELLESYSLDEVCAIQWQRCVEQAHEALRLMDRRRWIEVSYERFARRPANELSRIVDFLGLAADRNVLAHAVKDVRAESIGKSRAALDTEATRRLEHLVGDTLRRFDYA